MKPPEMNLQNSLQRISELNAWFVQTIKEKNAMGLLDINLVAEDILVPVFREVYGYKNLVNLNVEKGNFPGIDLGDATAGVVIQVTSDASSAKITDTLQKFKKDKLDEESEKYEEYQPYNHLFVYIITEKQKSYQGSYKGTEWSEIAGDKFKFSKDEDIRDHSDLMKTIRHLPVEKVKRVEVIFEEHFGGNADDEAQRKRIEQATTRYLKRLHQRCNVLPIAALGGDESATEEVGLDEVYIALDTVTMLSPPGDELPEEQASLVQDRSFPPDRDEKRKLSALEAATKTKKLVLLGDPGSGKSSFVRQLCGRLAAARLGPTEPPQDWPPLIPLFITLRQLGQRLATIDLEQLSHEEQQKALRDAVWQQWQEDIEDMKAAGMVKALPGWLDSGQLLLVFDGLDEIPIATRTKVREAIQAITNDYQDIAHTIVTCRKRSYAGELLLPGFDDHTLAPFDREKIHQFVKAWYQAQLRLERIGKEEAHTLTIELQDATTETDLVELAANPMLLTTMAIIHQGAVGLPSERVRLYALAVDVLLRRWQKRKGPLPEKVTAILNDDALLRHMLQHLAYEAHLQQSRGGEADLKRGQVLVLLEQPTYLGDIDLASAFLDYVDQRSGLLVGQGGEGHGGKPLTYAFPHRTFQEYLAGCHMVSGRSPARTYWQHVSEGDYWYLAAQLGAEELFYNLRRPYECLDLAYELAPNGIPTGEAAWRALIWSAYICNLLGQQQVERDDKPGGGAPFWQRLRDTVPQALRKAELPSQERAEAGRLLARIGDPRPGVLDVAQMEMCYVPGGPFVMGEAAGQHVNESLSQGYWICRFPVSQAHFRQFITADGYQNPNFWTEAIGNDVWREPGKVKGRYDNPWRSEPLHIGEPFSLANHPVVGLMWYEMQAFTSWLNTVIELPAGYRVQLPSEAEWEKAARGGTKIPPDTGQTAIQPLHQLSAPAAWPQKALVDNPRQARTYPWGETEIRDDAVPNFANYDETQIGSTNAAGTFPEGSSPYGCEELSGNVWEWTRSQDAEYPYDPQDGREVLAKVTNNTVMLLRGGSYYTKGASVRCAYRYGGTPDCGSYGIGFRVVVSPFISDR